MGLSGKAPTAPPSATKTANFTSPFGSVIGGQGTANFIPNLTGDQSAFLDSSNRGILDLSRQLQEVKSPTQLYGGPGYDAAYGLLSAPMKNQQAFEHHDMMANLNASNQLGGSNSAYLQDLQSRRFQDADMNAQNQAHQYAFQNNQQQYQNQLAAMQGLGASQKNLYDELFMPVTAAQGYAGINANQQGAALDYNARTYAAKQSANAAMAAAIGQVAGTIGAGFIPKP